MAGLLLHYATDTTAAGRTEKDRTATAVVLLLSRVLLLSSSSNTRSGLELPCRRMNESGNPAAAASCC